MQLNTIIALLALVEIVKGAWLAAVTQPVLLGLGAIMGALNMDVFDAQPMTWGIFIPTFNKNAGHRKINEEE